MVIPLEEKIEREKEEYIKHRALVVAYVARKFKEIIEKVEEIMEDENNDFYFLLVLEKRCYQKFESYSEEDKKKIRKEGYNQGLKMIENPFYDQNKNNHLKLIYHNRNIAFRNIITDICEDKNISREEFFDVNIYKEFENEKERFEEIEEEITSIPHPTEEDMYDYP